MGMLIEGSDVNANRYSVFNNAYAKMGAPIDATHTMTISREFEYEEVTDQLRVKCQDLQRSPINSYASNSQKSMMYDSKSQIKTVEISPVANKTKECQVARPPPKKKWIKEYLEEEPSSPVVRVVTALSVPRTNGVVLRATSPQLPSVLSATPISLITHEFPEHSRPRTASSNHVGASIPPSPPSASGSISGSSSNSSGGPIPNGLTNSPGGLNGISSIVGLNGIIGLNGLNGGTNGSLNMNGGNPPRAGTREVHNKLEKNRRAHLKECFELLKKQLPTATEDKKTSNLSILGSAIRHIQVLKRKEREYEHEMERLAREKIAAQQRLSNLKREAVVRNSTRPRKGVALITTEEKDDRINGHVLGIPISITSSAVSPTRIDTTSPGTLNLSTKLRTLPIQITPSTSQVVRTSYGARHNTLTLTTLAPANSMSNVTQNGHVENGVTNALSTTLVHPTIHLPLSQVVSSGGIVVNASALQLLSAPTALRVLQAPLHTNGLTTGDNRLHRENGIISPPPVTESSSNGNVVVNGLTPLVMSQSSGHLLHTHTLTHKMVETQVVKGSVAPLTVSAQYLSATTIMKPVVVVTSAGTT